MSLEKARPLGNALLYEGYALYPYRASSLKNRRRFDFGVLLPEALSDPGSDATSMRTECLVRSPSPGAVVDVTVRYLHLVERTGEGREPWHEAVEREVTLRGVELGCPSPNPVSSMLWTSSVVPEPTDTPRPRSETLRGSLSVSSSPEDDDLVRVVVRVHNETVCTPGDGDRGKALLFALVSTHTVLCVSGGEFVSLLDPPPGAHAAAGRCSNVGTWPVLVGEPWERDTVLSSPIILYDHPRVAPESPGDLFDATEIDEILTLRIQTLTDDEKRQIGAGDARVRALLERVDRIDAPTLARLHGVLSRRGGAGSSLKPGDRVRLVPRRRADLFDIALAGKAATVVSTEEDFEGQGYVTVTVDDDPGADLGLTGQPGHRFFFHPEEVELLP